MNTNSITTSERCFVEQPLPIPKDECYRQPNQPVQCQQRSRTQSNRRKVHEPFEQSHPKECHGYRPNQSTRRAEATSIKLAMQNERPSATLPDPSSHLWQSRMPQQDLHKRTNQRHRPKNAMESSVDSSKSIRVMCREGVQHPTVGAQTTRLR